MRIDCVRMDVGVVRFESICLCSSLDAVRSRHSSTTSEQTRRYKEQDIDDLSKGRSSIGQQANKKTPASLSLSPTPLTPPPPICPSWCRCLRDIMIASRLSENKRYSFSPFVSFSSSLLPPTPSFVYFYMSVKYSPSPIYIPNCM